MQLLRFCALLRLRMALLAARVCISAFHKERGFGGESSGIEGKSRSKFEEMFEDSMEEEDRPDDDSGSYVRINGRRS